MDTSITISTQQDGGHPLITIFTSHNSRNIIITTFKVTTNNIDFTTIAIYNN